MKRRYGGAVLAISVALLGGCSPSDREKTRERTEEARRKADRGAARAREEAHELAHRAKEGAHELEHNIRDAVNGTGSAQDGNGAARQKLRRGSEDLRAAGSEAQVKLSHAAMIAKVKAKLANDVGLSTVTSVEVDTSGQVVTLRGTVSSPEQKQQAENAVRQVSGVTRVINELQVQP